MDEKAFGGMFDFNRDGRLDSLERSAEYAFYQEFQKETESSFRSSGADWDDSGDSDDGDSDLD